MSEISNVIAELKRLKEIKDKNSACLRRYDEIQAEINSKSQEMISELAVRMNEFKEQQSERLEKFVPTEIYQYDESIPTCKTEEIKPLYPIAGLFFYVAIIFFIISTMIGIETGFFISFLCIIATFVCGGIWFFKNDKIGDYFEWKKERKKWFADASQHEVDKQKLMDDFKIFDDAFFNEMEIYENEENNAVEELENYNQKLKEPYEKELEMLYAGMDKCVNELSSSDVLHVDCVPYIEEILKNLETGRADSLKESINITLEDERKACEEANRQEEAKRQQEILQEQAYQNKMHNLAMEKKAEEQARAAREHAAIMEKQAKIQAQETMKLREELKRQNQNKKRY